MQNIEIKKEKIKQLQCFKFNEEQFKKDEIILKKLVDLTRLTKIETLTNNKEFIENNEKLFSWIVKDINVQYWEEQRKNISLLEELEKEGFVFGNNIERLTSVTNYFLKISKMKFSTFAKSSLFFDKNEARENLFKFRDFFADYDSDEYGIYYFRSLNYNKILGQEIQEKLTEYDSKEYITKLMNNADGKEILEHISCAYDNMIDYSMEEGDGYAYGWCNRWRKIRDSLKEKVENNEITEVEMKIELLTYELQETICNDPNILFNGEFHRP